MRRAVRRVLIASLLYGPCGRLFAATAAPLPPGPAAAPAVADVDPADVGRLAFRTFTDRDGLPQNTINALAIDARKYLWVATSDGAAYYNGRRWTVVNMPNRTRSNTVRCLLAGGDGGLWFGTDAGLHRWKDGQWTSWDVTSGLPQNEVHCLLETVEGDGSRTIWAGTNGGGLARLSAGTWTVLGKEAGLPSLSVSRLLEGRAPDGSRVVWAGTTDGGVARHAKGTWTTFDTRSGLPRDNISALLETDADDGSRTLWVGTVGGGLARYEKGRWTTFDTRSGLSNDNVYALSETREPGGRRVLWVGTYGGGLARFRDGRWSVFDERSGLPHNVIISLLDVGTHEGTQFLWVGTYGTGLVRLNPGGWTTFDRTNGLPNNVVLSFFETVDGGRHAVWIGTYGGGLTRLLGSRFTTWDTRSGLPNNIARSVLETGGAGEPRTLWVGTHGGGLARFSSGRWSVTDTRHGLPGDIVRSIAETNGPEGRTLWAACFDSGLAFLRNGVWRAVPREGAVPHLGIWCLLAARNATGQPVLWAGTKGGLDRLEEGRWTTFDTRSGLPNDSVLSLLLSSGRDGKRTLWAGTNGGGVARTDLSAPEPRWQTLSDQTRPALPNNVVYEIREDTRGRIYLFTNRGVARLTRRSPAAEEAEELTVDTFTTEDGLPSNEFNVGASMVDHRGRIWAGTAAGAVLYDPTQEVEDRTPKPLYIERVVLNGTDRRLAKNAPLRWDENNLEFDFALLSFFRESETVYRTQLVGLEPQLSEWTTESKRVFTTLPEGAYAFKVWGRDYAGNVSGPVAVSFTIRAAPWRTVWAFLAYLALVGGAAFLLSRARLRALHRRSEMLERKVAERTAALAESEKRAVDSERQAQDASVAKSRFLANMSHELRTPLNAILGYSEMLQEEASESGRELLVRDLQKIQGAGRHLLTLINDVLDLSKIEAGKMDLFPETFDVVTALHEAVSTVTPLVRKNGNTLRLSCDAPLGAMRADQTRVRQVLLNLLSNAAKFTSEGTIDVEALRLARDGEDWIHVCVRDTGIGLTAEQLSRLFTPFTQGDASTARNFGGTGIGLAISKRLCQLMGGEVTADSVYGEGATFTVRLPANTTAASPVAVAR